MIWDWLVQRTGKYCSIRRIEYPEFQSGIFGRMESTPRLEYISLAKTSMAWSFSNHAQDLRKVIQDSKLALAKFVSKITFHDDMISPFGRGFKPCNLHSEYFRLN